MYTVKASTIINAPIQEVYAKAASPHNGPIFIPNLNENSNISSERTQVGQSWQWRYNFFGVDVVGRAEVTELRPNARWALHTSGDIQSDWTYAFAERSGGTEVTLSVTYDMPESKLRNVALGMAERLNQKACEQAMENLKAWLEP